MQPIVEEMRAYLFRQAQNDAFWEVASWVMVVFFVIISAWLLSEIIIDKVRK